MTASEQTGGERLRLAASKGPLVLDVRLIENGQEVIDTICDRRV